MSAQAHQDRAQADLIPNRSSTQPGTVQRWAAAAVLVTGAVAANIAFFGLGSSFDYPDILDEPTQEVLQLFDDTRSSTMAWFATLALGAALLIPGAILLARFGSGRAAKWSAWAGVTAGVVQVIGLSVPGTPSGSSTPSKMRKAVDPADARHQAAAAGKARRTRIVQAEVNT